MDDRFLTAGEAEKVAQKFNIAELTVVSSSIAGPDDFMYKLKDDSDNTYVLWGRDYMSELKYEANYLKNNFNIIIGKWVPLKNAEDYEYFDEQCMYYSAGVWYALGKVERRVNKTTIQ